MALVPPRAWPMARASVTVCDATSVASRRALSCAAVRSPQADAPTAASACIRAAPSSTRCAWGAALHLEPSCLTSCVRRTRSGPTSAARCRHSPPYSGICPAPPPPAPRLRVQAGVQAGALAWAALPAAAGVRQRGRAAAKRWGLAAALGWPGPAVAAAAARAVVVAAEAAALAAAAALAEAAMLAAAAGCRPRP